MRGVSPTCQGGKITMCDECKNKELQIEALENQVRALKVQSEVRSNVIIDLLDKETVLADSLVANIQQLQQYKKAA